MPAPVTAMVNPIRPYAWGSDSALAGLQGREPPGSPEAELWMGDHPGAPSSLVLGGRDVPLPEVIATAPEAVLGETRATFGDRLPFLLKVLAIARPLSVQVHPTRARARAVFGTPGSPYQDDNHKPEMLYALEPTQALFGFRPAGEAAALLARLGSARLLPLLADLSKEGPDAERLLAALRTLITWPVPDRAALVAEVVAGVSGSDGAAPDGAEFEWVRRVAELHPADPMVLAPLLLDLVRLAPGETVYVPAGVPHCYLDGLGVEIMANSDNVLRCGLTSKEIAVEELLRIVDCRPRAVPAATVRVDGPVTRWAVPQPDFALARVDVAGSVSLDPVEGPAIVLCTAGSVTVSASGASVDVAPGHSAFVTAAAGPVTLTGSGLAFRATTG